VKVPNGKCISGEYLTTIFDEYPDAVKQFQVHQRADYSVIISVVPNVQYMDIEPVLMCVGNKLRKDADELVAVEVRKVASISHDRGKLHFVKSDIK
jgi:phenylacetate-CoA ligase